MIGTIYSKGGKVTANQDLGLKVASPVGTLVGQLLFGWLADLVGRKKMYGIELMLSESSFLALPAFEAKYDGEQGSWRATR